MVCRCSFTRALPRLSSGPGAQLRLMSCAKRRGRLSVSKVRATTILAVRRGSEVAMAGDGQVTVGDVIMKHSAHKVRTIFHGQVLAGFAGAGADAITLFDRFEGIVERQHGQPRRAAFQ